MNKFAEVLIEKLLDARPCDIRHLPVQIGMREYFG